MKKYMDHHGMQCMINDWTPVIHRIDPTIRQDEGPLVNKALPPLAP